MLATLRRSDEVVYFRKGTSYADASLEVSYDPRPHSLYGVKELHQLFVRFR